MTSPLQGSGPGTSTSQFYTYTADGERVIKPGVDPVLVQNLELLARQADEWASSSSVDDMPRPNMDALVSAEGASLSGLSSGVATDIAAFLALFRDFAVKQRETALQMNSAAMRESIDHLLNAADQMRKSGALNFEATTVEANHQIGAGIAQTGTAAVSMVATGYSVHQSNKAGEAKNAADEAAQSGLPGSQKMAADLNAASAQYTASAGNVTTVAQSLNQAATGVSTVVDAAGKMKTADIRLEIATTEATKADEDAASQEDQNAAQIARSVADSAVDIMKAVDATTEAAIRSQAEIAAAELKV